MKRLSWRGVRLLALTGCAIATISIIGVGGAAADSSGAITFEPPTYHTGDINGQNGWTKTGSYDVNVVDSNPLITYYGFGSQALQSSDAFTTGGFGDQTFAPALAHASSETGNQTFDASFSIGTATATPNDGSHISISPDNGQGGRMSYLRFEYHSADGQVHVFFEDSDQSTACSPAGCANFRDVEIAHFAPGTAHSFRFAITLNPGVAASGAPNDVVKVYEDNGTSPLITGTTWEGYYRYDPESGPTSPPAISTLLFRESGTANSADEGQGFLLDNVAFSNAPKCTATGLMRDGLNLTAAQIGGNVSGTLDATGCNIGVYYGPGTSGTVSAANIFGANYYGVVADGAHVDVTNSQIHDIGESPFNGTQHGVAVLYTTVHQDGSTTLTQATGTLSGSIITRYQKNGVVVSGSGAAVTVANNTVTGNGPVNYIAQNGIQVSSGATASVTGNTVSGNFYTPATVTACGLLFFQAGGVKQQKNTLFDNQTNLCNAGRGSGGFNP